MGERPSRTRRERVQAPRCPVSEWFHYAAQASGVFSSSRQDSAALWVTARLDHLLGPWQRPPRYLPRESACYDVAARLDVDPDDYRPVRMERPEQPPTARIPES